MVQTHSSTQLNKWESVKSSSLLDTNYGLFVEMKFQVRDIFSIYLGKVLTKYSDSYYTLECGISESTGSNQSKVAEMVTVAKEKASKVGKKKYSWTLTAVDFPAINWCTLVFIR